MMYVSVQLKTYYYAYVQRAQIKVAKASLILIVLKLRGLKFATWTCFQHKYFVWSSLYFHIFLPKMRRVFCVSEPSDHLHKAAMWPGSLKEQMY